MINLVNLYQHCPITVRWTFMHMAYDNEQNDASFNNYTHIILSITSGCEIQK